MKIFTNKLCWPCQDMQKKLKWLLRSFILTVSSNMLLLNLIWKFISMVVLPEFHAKTNHRKMSSLYVQLNPIISFFTFVHTSSENLVKTLSSSQKKLKMLTSETSLKNYFHNHSNHKNQKLWIKLLKEKQDSMEKTVASSEKIFEPFFKSFNMIKTRYF